MFASPIASTIASESNCLMMTDVESLRSATCPTVIFAVSISVIGVDSSPPARIVNAATNASISSFVSKPSTSSPSNASIGMASEPSASIIACEIKYCTMPESVCSSRSLS